MPTISVAMIVKNEAQDLAACLDTVKDWVDEIVIVDSGSTDSTEDIALFFQAKFYKHLLRKNALFYASALAPKSSGGAR